MMIDKSNINKVIYNKKSLVDSLEINVSSSYDALMVRRRFAEIERYGRCRDVLDLCCGSGSYLLPMLNVVKSAVGLDFSSSMLDCFRRKLNGCIPHNLTLLEASADNIPLPSESFDFVFSYSSLCYIADLDVVINEIARVLRKGMYAFLELGNSCSVNHYLVNNYYHPKCGWPKLMTPSYRVLLDIINGSGLEVVRHRSLQVLPLYGGPKMIPWLWFLAHPLWKKLLGIRIGECVLDEYISSNRLLRSVAFRHLFWLKKKR